MLLFVVCLPTSNRQQTDWEWVLLNFNCNLERKTCCSAADGGHYRNAGNKWHCCFVASDNTSLLVRKKEKKVIWVFTSLGQVYSHRNARVHTDSTLLTALSLHLLDITLLPQLLPTTAQLNPMVTSFTVFSLCLFFSYYTCSSFKAAARASGYFCPCHRWSTSIIRWPLRRAHTHISFHFFFFFSTRIITPITLTDGVGLRDCESAQRCDLRLTSPLTLPHLPSLLFTFSNSALTLCLSPTLATAVCYHRCWPLNKNIIIISHSSWLTDYHRERMQQPQLPLTFVYHRWCSVLLHLFFLSSSASLPLEVLLE